MSGKVKISLADKKDLDKCMSFYFGNKTFVFNAFAYPGNSELTEYFFADRLKKKFSLLEIAELVNGNYEIGRTPEEELLLEYKKLQQEVESSWHPATKERLNFGLSCIRTTLDIQGVKIEGINK